MIEFFSVLTWWDILFAACIAWSVFNLLNLFKRRAAGAVVERKLDMIEVNDQCKTLFPIERLYFQGREFTRGMQVKIITIQKKIIEGEFIGVNEKDLVCIRTTTQIIVHQKEKIEEISTLN